MSSSYRKPSWNEPGSLRPTLLVSALCLGVAITIWITVRPDSSSSRLRTMRSELRARGEALSQKELVARPPRWDLMRPFTNAVASLNQLHLDPSLKLMNYTSNGVALPLWQMEKPSWAYNTPQATPPVSWQELTSVVDKAKPILEQIRAIPTEPLANPGLGGRIPVFDLIVASQWLGVATVVALHRGDRASALQNVEAGVALAQIGREEPDFICQIGRSAVITITMRATWEALQYPGWTEPELCRLQAAWESVTPLNAAELALKGELAQGGDWDEDARHLPHNEPIEKRIEWPFYLMFQAPADQLFCLSYRWDGLQVARAIGSHEPWIVLKPQVQAIRSRLLKMVTPTSHHWIPGQTLPKVTELLENCVHNETGRQLLLADIAIRRFELQHNGAAPGNLAELTSDFLKAPSRDPMTGKQLLYRAGPDGAYLLYSAGEDGLDDGGDPTPISGDPPGLWNARDVVWPRSSCPPKFP